MRSTKVSASRSRSSASRAVTRPATPGLDTDPLTGGGGEPLGPLGELGGDPGSECPDVVRAVTAGGEPGAGVGGRAGGDQRGTGTQRAQRGGQVARGRRRGGIPAGDRLAGAVEEVEGGGGVGSSGSPRSWCAPAQYGLAAEPVVVVAAEVEHPGRPEGGRASTRQTRRCGLGRPGSPGRRAGHRPRATRPGAPATRRAPRTRCSAGHARRSRAGRRRRCPRPRTTTGSWWRRVTEAPPMGRTESPTDPRGGPWVGRDQWMMSNTCSTFDHCNPPSRHRVKPVRARRPRHAGARPTRHPGSVRSSPATWTAPTTGASAPSR